MIQKRAKRELPMDTGKGSGNYIRDNIEGNIINDYNILVGLINASITEHATASPNCKNLQIGLQSFWKRGYSWCASVVCKSCTYVSRRIPIYKTISEVASRKGPKTSAVDLGLALGRQETSIDAERFNFAIAHGGLSTPSTSACQQNANIVTDVVVDLNKEDMAEKIKTMKDIMEARGFLCDASIGVQYDVQYNGSSGILVVHPGCASHSAQ